MLLKQCQEQSGMKIQRALTAMVCGMALVLSACQGVTDSTTTTTPPPTTTPPVQQPATIQAVNHVIFMLQENRSFDHYFGKLGEYKARNGWGAAY